MASLEKLIFGQGPNRDAARNAAKKGNDTMTASKRQGGNKEKVSKEDKEFWAKWWKSTSGLKIGKKKTSKTVEMVQKRDSVDGNGTNYGSAHSGSSYGSDIGDSYSEERI